VLVYGNIDIASAEVNGLMVINTTLESTLEESEWKSCVLFADGIHIKYTELMVEYTEA
jgi:hypothetical protein